MVHIDGLKGKCTGLTNLSVLSMKKLYWDTIFPTCSALTCDQAFFFFASKYRGGYYRELVQGEIQRACNDMQANHLMPNTMCF